MGDVVRVGLLGFGTIGSGVVRLLKTHRAEIARRAGGRIELAVVADLDLTTDRGVDPAPARLTTDGASVIADPGIDVVIELIGGYGVARRLVEGAIGAGKDVITANKALLAVHGAGIVDAAERAGVRLSFEAAIGGGIPIVRALKEGLAGDRTTEIYGIVNGTCNHILTTMTRERRDFADVLVEAQRLGLAEADPSTDVDGVDSAHKLALLTALAFGVVPNLDGVGTEGIRHVTKLDIAYADELGYVVKLLAIARDGRDAIEARVHPTLVPKGHLLADVSGNFNAIVAQGKALGPTLYYGQGAGSLPTATAVVADLIATARDRRIGRGVRVLPWGVPQHALRRVPTRSVADLEGEYYLRCMAMDRPGVLGRVATVLGRNAVSIASVIQKAPEGGRSVPLVLRTHRARRRNLDRALAAIAKLDGVRGTPVAIPIEERLA